MKPIRAKMLPTKRVVIDYLNGLDHKLLAERREGTEDLFDISFEYSFTTYEITGFTASRPNLQNRNPADCFCYSVTILGCEFSWGASACPSCEKTCSYLHPDLENGELILDYDGVPIDMETELCHALNAHIEMLRLAPDIMLLSRKQILEALESMDSMGDSYFTRLKNCVTGPVLFIENSLKRTGDLIQVDLETATEIMLNQHLPLEIL